MRISPQLAALVALLVAAPLCAGAPGIYAFVGGTVHTASGADIENGVVVIRSGLIERAGANVPIPADATTIDVKGMHLYPGLFDAFTTMGMPAPPKSSGSWWEQGVAKQEPAKLDPLPSLIAARVFKPDRDALEAKRSTGVTTVLTAYGAGIFRGQAAVVNLGDETPERMLIKTPAALVIGFDPRNDAKYPDSLMGVFSHLRQSFLDAQHYGAASSIYQRNPAGKKRPLADAELDAIGPAVRREMAVIFFADSEEMIRRASEIASEFNLRWIVAGGRQSYRAADFLQSSRVPVLFQVKFAKAPSKEEDRKQQSLRAIRDRVMSPTGPAEMAKRGVRFALVSGGASSSEFISGIRRVIESGLSETDALRATTLWPAQILGVDRQIGSIDAGKIANLFVTDKKFFERDAKVKHLVIDGALVRVTAEEKKEGESSGAAIDGVWALTIRATEGEIAMELNLRAEEGRLSGTYSGDRGSGDIRDGSFEGDRFGFTITARATEGAETSDWKFSGTLDGGTMKGTVTTTSGSLEFTGSQSK